MMGSGRRRMGTARRSIPLGAFIVTMAMLFAPRLGRAVATDFSLRPDNVAQLRLAFALPTDRVGAELSGPVFANDTLYVLTPFPHELLAVDPTPFATKRIRWIFVPPANPVADGLMCCDLGQHGPVLAGGKTLFSTFDGHVFSVDPDGHPGWDAALTDLAKGETMAGPPAFIAGKVLVGSAGDDNGARGWIAALDAASGHLLWKRFNVGSDGDVGIGATFQPFYDADKGTDLGIHTWPPDAWRQGGGGVAGAIAADPATGLVYHGTGHPAPWNADERRGDNKWTSGVFARDAATGDARWFDGFNRHGALPYREAGTDLLVDRAWRGASRHLLVHPDANGYLYVIDRSSGEILAADPFVASTVSKVDLTTGMTSYFSSQMPRVAKQTRDVCPAWTGAITGQPGVLLPESRIVVLPTSRLCMDIEPRPANYIAGTPYTGANVRLLTPQAAGGVVAWDLDAQRPAWQVDERFPVLGGVLVTTGGLVVYGTLDGYVKALDARNGRTLWSYKAPAGVMSQPMTFRMADGRSYIAVVAGTGRMFGMSRKESLDPRNPGSGFGLAGFVGLLPEDKDPRGILLVFGLP